MEFSVVMLGGLVLLGVSLSFFVSASAGVGGSIVLVPVLVLVLGAKQGISLAVLLLAGNNLVKLWAYRQALPLTPAGVIVAHTLIGAFLGARLLVAAPAALVSIAVVLSLGASVVSERFGTRGSRRSHAWLLAFAAGATSGFSGSSGPLKGVAIRSLGLDRMHTIGAGAVVSLAADLIKTAVFSNAGLFDAASVRFAVAAIPLMLAATFAGRHCAQAIDEKGYTRLFWVVIGGYAVRLLVVR